MNTPNYNFLKLYKKDRKSAKLEIKELEILLKQAKTQYKEVFQEDYDDSWYGYITNAFQWLNPLNYIQSKFNIDPMYYVYSYSNSNYMDESNFNEGYDMYSSVYETIESDFDMSDNECEDLD